MAGRVSSNILARGLRGIRSAGPRRLALTGLFLLGAVLLARLSWNLPVTENAESGLYDLRAFIGAGGRQVIASHWPAPEEYGATTRLFSAFFEAPPGTSLGEALRAAQVRLMDDPETSHPFYWSGFALIGDGERPLFSGS